MTNGPCVNHPVLWSCHLGRGWVLGLPHPYIYAQLNHQAVVEIITNETARALNLLVKQGTKIDAQCYLLKLLGFGLFASL
jgi:hypothetical protein